MSRESLRSSRPVRFRTNISARKAKSLTAKDAKEPQRAQRKAGVKLRQTLCRRLLCL